MMVQALENETGLQSRVKLRGILSHRAFPDALKLREAPSIGTLNYKFP